MISPQKLAPNPQNLVEIVQRIYFVHIFRLKSSKPSIHLEVFQLQSSEASFARLALVSEEKFRRQEKDEVGADAALEAEILGMALELALDEKTGKRPEEWEAWEDGHGNGHHGNLRMRFCRRY